MHRSATTAASIALCTAAGAGLIYLACALARVRQFARQTPRPPRSFPPITILKPICGLETGLVENLASFCEQAYPEYQIVFTVQDSNDPAIPLVRRLLQRYPGRDFTLAIGSHPPAINPKVANLAAALPYAKHDLFVIADADVRVGPTYLQAIAPAFEDEQTGAATCPYGAMPRGNGFSHLGALHINDHFMPSVLVSTMLGPPRFCLGATMCVRRTVLEEIGGFAALQGHLGDDYMLGAAVAERGYTVALVPYVVHTIVSEKTLGALFAHQLRWARTIRMQRPLGYAFLFITYPLPLAALYLVVARGSGFAWALFLATALLRTLLHVAAHATFAARERDANWLAPFSDALNLVIWLTGCFGTTVRWKNHHFAIHDNGRIDILENAQGKSANGA